MPNIEEVKPSVSVIIPLYNKAPYIKRAVDSVLAQTIQDFQIIIVGGRSKDNGESIVSSYNDSRIHLIQEMGVGVSVARNQGVAEAKSDIVAFLDADDEWRPQFLETILQLRKEFPKAEMYGTAFDVYSGDKFLRSVIHNNEEGNRQFLSYFKEFTDVGHPIIITSGFAVSRNIFEAVGGYRENLKIGEDHELFGKIALSYPIAYSPQVCSKYSIGADNNADIVEYVLEVPLESYLKEHNIDVNADSALSEYMDHWRLRMGGRNIYSGYCKEGRCQLRQITSKNYLFIKTGFLLLSYMPFSLSKLPPNFVRSVLRVVGLSI